jgi:hypothetical protein
MPCSGIIKIAHSEGGVAPDTMGETTKKGRSAVRYFRYMVAPPLRSLPMLPPYTLKFGYMKIIIYICECVHFTQSIE